MTDAERFQQTFSHLHASDGTLTEVMNMTVHKKPIRRYSRRIMLAAAAVMLMAALSITAYAADLFGIRALVVRETTDPDSGEIRSTISITQPQEVGQELDPAIAGKVENSRLAWAEWENWRANSPDALAHQALVEKFNPENASAAEITENDDGTVTYDYYNGETFVESRTFTAAEQQEYLAAMDACQLYESGYDFNYWVQSDAQKAKLEEIAGRYGLRLRGGAHYAFSSESTGQTGGNFYTNARLTELTATEMGNAGNIFTQVPVGFDKVYWFDEGTFAVSFYVDLPSSGERVTCYGYNSMYATLSSGREVMSEIDPADFTAREYTAADGTVLTVLENGREAYLYVFLENSFFAEHIHAPNGSGTLTAEDVDHIAGYLNYSLIGQ